jgi:GMP synthase-like glutamine amidotransferase
MKLAILVTNTDESEFAQSYPKDGEKFAVLIAEQRPEWKCEVFSVKDGDFPKDIGQFDGFIITGSPASVGGGESWIAELLGMIREIAAARIPMFGACFGHQAIALALGGTIGRNPDGWAHGYVTTTTRARPVWMADAPDQIGLYASHIEQVTQAPAGAQIVASAPGCLIGGFAIDRHVFTTQYHPEMSDAFMAALVETLAGYVGDEATDHARQSLRNTADRHDIGRQITAFFESASD